MMLSFTCCARLTVQMVLFGVTGDAALGSGEPLVGKHGGPFPLSVETVAGVTVRPIRTSVEWEGREYDIESGIPVLMSAVRDAKQTRHNRGWALSQLAMLTTQLKGRPCLDELARLYDVPGAVGKGGILLCFMGSDDPRGIPVFIHTLDKEKDFKLRLSAAAGLAQWNIRRGVAELVDLLESKERLLLPGGLMPYVRDNALDLFETKNHLKGWGFPDQEIRKAIEGRAGLDREGFVASYTAEIKKWFAENERRFPDWKPGDPLPEVPAPDMNKSTGE